MANPIRSDAEMMEQDFDMPTEVHAGPWLQKSFPASWDDEREWKVLEQDRELALACDPWLRQCRPTTTNKPHKKSYRPDLPMRSVLTQYATYGHSKMKDCAPATFFKLTPAERATLAARPLTITRRGPK